MASAAYALSHPLSPILSAACISSHAFALCILCAALKPVERRTLHSPKSSFSQGKLEMWMEIMTPAEAKAKPLINITPPPPDPFELRVIVWGIDKVAHKEGNWTENSDFYCQGAVSIPGLKVQCTWLLGCVA